MNDHDKIPEAVIQEAKKTSSATIHEAAGKIGNLPSAIKPVDPSFKVCGRALTVFSPPRDNLWLHKAIYEAQPGDVLVVHVGDFYEAGYFGEVMACAAQARHIAGLVIDGGVRDREQLIDMNFPVFSRGLCIRGTGKDKEAYGAINKPIRIGEVGIFAGDLIYGDSDGVVVIPKNDAENIIKLANERDLEEQKVMKKLKAGERTLDIFNLT